MPLFRKKGNDPEMTRILSAFRTCAGRIDSAQRALLSAIPIARDEGRPLDEALADFRQQITSAEEAMASWRGDTLAHEWTSCADAIAAARAEADSLGAAGSLGFEALNARVGDILLPLEAFAEAAVALRRLSRVG